MRPFACFISCLFLLSILSGCATHQFEMGQRLESGKINQIIEGKTSEAEAISLLGQPQQTVNRSDGAKILIYSHHLTKMTRHPVSPSIKGSSSSITLFLGIRDGLVKKKWQSSSSTPLASSNSLTFSD